MSSQEPMMYLCRTSPSGCLIKTNFTSKDTSVSRLKPTTWVSLTKTTTCFAQPCLNLPSTCLRLSSHLYILCLAPKYHTDEQSKFQGQENAKLSEVLPALIVAWPQKQGTWCRFFSTDTFVSSWHKDNVANSKIDLLPSSTHQNEFCAQADKRKWDK